MPFFICLWLLGNIKAFTEACYVSVLPVLLSSGIYGNIVGGEAFGFLSPIFATFEAVEGGRKKPIYLSCTVVAAVLGIIVDMQVISFVAMCRGPYMFFERWNHLFHDLEGQEGSFLERMYVTFTGLTILLGPLAVIGAVLTSMVASIFLAVQVLLLSLLSMFAAAPAGEKETMRSARYVCEQRQL